MNTKVRRLGRYIKAFYYRKKYRLRSVHKTVYFGGKSHISRDLIADRYVYIGPGCYIHPNVQIGEFTLLGDNVSIIGGDHKYDMVGTPILLSGREEILKTTIGKDCWLCSHSIILSGVNIADGTIVAAGAVVTKDTEPYSIYGGVPARKISNRFKTDEERIAHIEGINNINDDKIVERLFSISRLKNHIAINN